MKFKKIMIYILIFVLCFGLTACGDGISNKDLQKIFVENGLSQSEVKDVKIEKVINLENDIGGLDSGKDNKLILVSYDNKYAKVIVNIKTNNLIDTITGYIPLNAVSYEIQCSDLDTNIKDVLVYKKYLEKYGVGCLENQEYAIEYLREITGKNGIIDTERARKVISNSNTEVFSNIDSADDITILFENDNAVPMYYIGTETEMVYNWWSLWPEYQYEMVKASLDRNTLSRIAAMYGQPYVMQTVWVALDKDLNRLGTYDSFEDAKTKLLSKNTNETNTPKSGTVIVYKVNLSNKKTNTLDVVKEMIALRLKNMGYDDVTINIKDSDKIEVTLPTQDNIEDFAKTLISSSNLKLTDYKENVLLTDTDIKKVSVEQDTDNSPYYILLKFTKEGKSKFKKATSEVAKIAPPNNHINIVIDNSIISSPTITQEIDTDSCMISGKFSQEEVKDFERQINYAINKPEIEILETR